MKKLTLRIFSTICILLASLQTVNAQQFKALVFTKTSGWHHESINAGVTALQKMAKEHYFDLQWQTNADRITDKQLKKFDVVIFLSTTGDILNQDQQAALERFIQSGKGFVGIHSASDTEYEWPWYQKLIGRSFVIHPKIQTAVLKVNNRKFPGLARMPDQFLWTEEWYQYSDAYVDNLSYLLSVDEGTYDAKVVRKGKTYNGMGSFHPVAWYHNYDGGRSFYTGLGHMNEHYSNTLFLEHLYGGIYWAATGKGLIK
ncbi:ThuA domain-containing protein [Pseudocolwellia sp. AS88]|uniref:ThuA domain-containing protein n=1 Tax=Pseudocolwellia sp. AS88 TaxID=3063958 RepID=UPI0026F08672|nr:ThuA domain-containing protein [Pseudocolwellia sp. AS88]MDO7085537.1 ThuA domain-containing protein [Pseudocolwellia sp. AS88]